MARAAAIQTGFNNGEVSPFMYGRVDADKYPLSVRELTNMMVLVQGPATKRDATRFVAPVDNEAKTSRLFEFEFSPTQGYIIELNDSHIRFLTNRGLVLNDDDSVYRIASPYATGDIAAITDLHSADVITLMHGSYQPRKLTRNGAADWSLDTFVFKDGPYLTEDTKGVTLTPSGYGAFAPVMTSNSTPSGTASSSDGSDSAYAVFDRNPMTDAVLAATGSVTYAGTTAKVTNAYWLQASSATDFRNEDMPTAWTVDGSNDGSTWITLDTRDGETGWSAGEKRFYTFINKAAFVYLRLNFSGGGQGQGSGSDTYICEWTPNEAGDGQTPFTLTASSAAGINGGAGFKATDAGRSIRVFGGDGKWRWVSIDSVVSSTVVNVKMYGQALPNLAPIQRWRLGMFSDTTGWPTCGCFYQDRQVFSGPPTHPNYVCFSVSQVYDTFTPSEDDGTVTDASGFAYPLIEQQVTAINWLQPVDKGVIIGMAEGEGIIQTPTTTVDSTSVLSALNIKVLWPTNYGSEQVRPRKADTAVLFADRRGTRIREMAYNLQGDTFTAPDMNAMADHITAGGITRLAWQRHPYRILWAACADGRLLSFSYEREEQVTAWGSHKIGGTNVRVEDCAVISSPDGKSEDLWLVVSRTINGATHRYIEYIGDWFWHDTKQVDACFVDSATSYVGATAVSTVAGLSHLEGETVRVLADGMQVFPDPVVSGGQITIPVAAKTITVGLPYTARLWTLRPNVGSQNGTAQGKMKRIYKYVVRLYRSLGGKIGDGSGRFNELPYWYIANSYMGPLELFSGDIGPLAFPGGWELDGGTVFENDTAYPFTILAYMPQMITEDA